MCISEADAHAAHAAWVGDLARQIEQGIHTAEEPRWVARTSDEIDNFSVALNRLVDADDLDQVFAIMRPIESECYLRMRPDFAPVVERLIERCAATGDDRLGVAASFRFRFSAASLGLEAFDDLREDLENALSAA